MTTFILFACALLLVTAGCIQLSIPAYRAVDRWLEWRKVRRTWKARRDELRLSRRGR